MRRHAWECTHVQSCTAGTGGGPREGIRTWGFWLWNLGLGHPVPQSPWSERGRSRVSLGSQTRNGVWDLGRAAQEGALASPCLSKCVCLGESLAPWQCWGALPKSCLLDTCHGDPEHLLQGSGRVRLWPPLSTGSWKPSGRWACPLGSQSLDTSVPQFLCWVLKPMASPRCLRAAGRLEGGTAERGVTTHTTPSCPTPCHLQAGSLLQPRTVTVPKG